MLLKEIKEDVSVWDDDAPQFGEGTIIRFEDSLVEVYYPDIEETVTYSERDAVRYLNLVEL